MILPRLTFWLPRWLWSKQSNLPSDAPWTEFTTSCLAALYPRRAHSRPDRHRRISAASSVPAAASTLPSPGESVMQTDTPLRGWRAFSGEVGIIVVGVLLALGAQQVVETLHSGRETQDALRVIREELAQSAGVFEERVLVQPCLDRRLDELGAVIATARRTHRIPAIGEIGRPPLRPIQSTGWLTASAQGIVANFPDTQRNELSIFYSQGAGYSKEVEAELEMWAILRVLEESPGPIDETLLAQAMVTLQRLRFRSWLNGINASQLLDAIRAARIPTDYYLIADEGEKLDKAGLKAKLDLRPICRPLRIPDSGP